MINTRGGSCRRMRMPAAVVCLALGLLGRAAVADEITLADLLADPGETIISADGLLEFSDFSYSATLGAAAAPLPSAIRLISDSDAPGGFRFVGPFQALNDVDVVLSLGFTATSLSGESIRWAGAALSAASVYGIRTGEEDAESSVVRLTETVSAIESEAQERFDIFLNANGSANVVDRIFLDPDEFGTSVRVSQLIDLSSVQSDGGSISALSVFSPGFGVVPEPATLILMIVAAPAVLGRMRRKRGL